MKDKKIAITNHDGIRIPASAPLIVSASRATDIPAFYTDWLMYRLQAGYCAWRNPWSGVCQYVSFNATRFIVFWSKNPAPLLERIDELNVPCYIQYTLNDYEEEGLEPGVPKLQQRIATFHKLVEKLGAGSVLWRFDPLILTDKTDISELLEKIRRLSSHLEDYTDRLVFSFADIAVYRKVSRNLQIAGINYQEWSEPKMQEFAKGLASLHLPMRLMTCAETVDLSPYGIEHSRCIDPGLIALRSPDDPVLQAYLWGAGKDKGQRAACGCIGAKDIGAYTTCPHGCLYCYANTSSRAAQTAYAQHNPNSETLN